ncbi:MAG TPA: helix-turn-helix transcriptional regulator [Coriobacteriia bacterium]|jgi:hypothetical protein
MTNAELAVLSLVAEAPRHGYEIEQVIAERDMRDWTDIGFSSIYYLLGKMQKRGWVEAREEPGERGPGRKVYAATAEGYAACGAASLEALSTLGGASPFFLGLNNLPGLDPADALAALRRYRGELEARLAHVEVKHASAGEVPWSVDALFDYGEVMLKAERGWVAGLIRKLERERKGETAMAMKPNVPQIVELPARTMAVVKTTGDPNEVGRQVFPALYGAVYTLKFALKKQGVEYKMEAPRARWFNGPDWKSVPRDQWRAEWAIPVPDGTAELAQKVSDVPVEVETWEYGTVAQVLYAGSYAEEEPAIVALHEFIAEQGYEIAGAHEEEYLSRPEAKNPKTVIRYQVRKKKCGRG